MSTINNLYQRFKSLDTDKVASEAVSDTSPERVTLNIEQLNSGFRSDGSELLPSYTDNTIAIKRGKGQETRWVTLLDTGAFYDGIKSDVNGENITTDSIDSKTGKLQKKYETAKGKLFGLGSEFKIEYIDKDLRPALKTKIENVLQLKFK